jgi:hypothetical protein
MLLLHLANVLIEDVLHMTLLFSFGAYDPLVVNSFFINII